MLDRSFILAIFSELPWWGWLLLPTILIGGLWGLGSILDDIERGVRDSQWYKKRQERQEIERKAQQERQEIERLERRIYKEQLENQLNRKVSIACPYCAAALAVQSDAIGKHVRCPGCKRQFTARI